MKTAGIAPVIGIVSAIYASAEAGSYAAQISNPQKNYTFDLPAGWSIDKKQRDFTIRAGADFSISELPTPPPPPGAKLAIVSSMNQMAALATGLCGKVIDENIVVRGHKWQGDAFVCNNPTTATVAPRQVLALTVKRGGEYHVFALTMPAHTWPKQRDFCVSLLSSLRFDGP